MVTYRKILLPVDGSESSKLARLNAIAIAKLMGAEIILSYITGPIPEIVMGKAKEEAIKAQKEEAEQILAPFREDLKKSSVLFSQIIGSGIKPGDEICRIAQRQGCDLIVMGSRGLSNLKGLLLGSVTHRVLSHCHLPVLVVR